MDVNAIHPRPGWADMEDDDVGDRIYDGRPQTHDLVSHGPTRIWQRRRFLQLSHHPLAQVGANAELDEP